MKINANSLKIGNVINYKSDPLIILKKDHVQPGKGGAYVQIEARNIENNSKQNIRLHSDDNIEKMFVEEKKMQYQYSDNTDIIAMDMDSFEQYSFSKDLLGNDIYFLQEGMDIFVKYCDEKAIEISLDENIVVTIEETDEVIKNPGSTSSYKTALIKNGIRINVPKFISSGEKIVIRTKDKSYIERFKN